MTVLALTEQSALTGHAVACANIALAKYWGKVDSELNLPAVPSVSLTLDALRTETSVAFIEGALDDQAELDGEPARPVELERVRRVLDRVRRESGLALAARVESRNTFPRASGLASSASGFAALVAAARAAAGLSSEPDVVSRWARGASVSAARSVFGGFAELAVGVPGDDSLSATPLLGASAWDVRMVIAVTDGRAKKVGSTEGMERTRRSSPYFSAWVDFAVTNAHAVRHAVLARDLTTLGPLMEQSTYAMHACALAAEPAIRYWSAATLEAISTVERLRSSDGVEAWYTMDAGPHVKVLCATDASEVVERALMQTPGVTRVLVAAPGPGITINERGRS